MLCLRDEVTFLGESETLRLPHMVVMVFNVGQLAPVGSHEEGNCY
jgi:hypothetical protein